MGAQKEFFMEEYSKLYIPNGINPEYELAKSIIKWLVEIKMLTPSEAKGIDKLNRKSFLER